MMFKSWALVIRALTRADVARDTFETRNDPESEAAYHARLRDLHDALRRFDQGQAMARIAALIVKSET